MADEYEDREDAAQADETPQEEATQADTGETPQEAHRTGEFDDLRDRLEALASRADEILEAVKATREALGSFAADSGAVVRENEEDTVDEVNEDTDEVDLDTPIEELDLNIDEEDN